MSDSTSPLTSDLDDSSWRQVADWLSGTDIEFAEITGPEWHVRMSRETSYLPKQTFDTSVRPPQQGSLVAARVRKVVVTAALAGIFLDRHPLRSSPLVKSGASVRQGEIVGLLRLGSVLAPVISPIDGVMTGNLVISGALVGFGTELLEIRAGER